MAPTATTRVPQETACPPTLVLAFALGVHPWQLGCTTGAAPRPRERQVPPGDCPTVREEIRRGQSRFGWPEEARVVSGDAVGREGGWLHRFFGSQGVEHVGGDSARLAVNRRYRRAKPDHRDVHQRLTLRLRPVAGAKQGWRVGRGPSVAAEDRRPVPRARVTTKRDRPRVSKGSKGLLAGDGMRMAWHGAGETARAAGRQCDSPPRPAAWRARLRRAWPKVQQLTAPLGSVEAERRAGVRPRAERGMEQGRHVATLRGLGVTSAWRFGMAFLAWRDWQRPKPVGA